MKVPELCLYKSFQKQKMVFARHVLRGSSGENALLLLEGKIDAHVAQGRPRRIWIDDIKNWTKLDTNEKIKRNAADRLKWRTYTTTFQPSTTEDDS